MKPFTCPAAFLALALVAGCAQQAQRSENPYPPVPAPVVEMIPKPPVTAQALEWQPGHWDWNGSGYVWARGQYVPAAGHGQLWMPGWWARTDAGWVWRPAHWTS
ncbi:MAG TPA: hypothetical protein VFG12_04115 [Rhodopila sp.]|jgi:hypothetical protein|nr:hypothetical protein [Rhodopila sp.]